MKAVSGYTLIEYIKSSIEILMNMKLDDADGEPKKPPSSTANMQRDQIQSPSSCSSYSVPEAHREYEKTLRQLESECRNHIKVEQQMKLHIETM